uniref:Immunoglobin superfamily, member 21b n=1 Tax=Eptatretus burgeri TaxID=7764 RepID=A0A8C4N547_EPTBU
HRSAPSSRFSLCPCRSEPVCLSCYLTVVVEQRVITVTAGDPVTLTCRMHTDGLLCQVTWYKVRFQKITLPLISFFLSLHIACLTSRNRLAEVRPHDHGSYQCEVVAQDHSQMLEATGHLFLNVMVPPSSISLLAADVPTPSNGLTSHNLTLVCIVPGGKPAPTVYFRRDGNLLQSESSQESPVSLAPAALRQLPNTQPRHHPVLPPDPVPDDTKPDGDLALAALQDAEGRRHTPTQVSWQKSKVAEKEQLRVIHFAPGYSLRRAAVPGRDGSVEVRLRLSWVFDLRSDDKALFSCEIQHPALSMPMRIDPAGWPIHSFEMILGAFPEPTFTWTRVGGPLPGGRTQHVGRSLDLPTTLHSLNGSLFHCVAQNQLGSAEAHLRLTIYGVLYLSQTSHTLPDKPYLNTLIHFPPILEMHSAA